MFSEGISGFPWYLYAGAGGFLFLFGKTVANIATDMIKAIEVEEAADAEALLAKEKKTKKWSNTEDEVEETLDIILFKRRNDDF